MDIAKRVNKFQRYGLLDNDFEYLVINPLVDIRNRLIEETSGIQESDYCTILKNINSNNLQEEMYVDNLQRNLTQIEQISLISIQLLESALDSFGNNSSTGEDLFIEIFRAYKVSVYCENSIKLKEHHDGNIDYSDILLKVVKITKPLVDQRKKFDESKRAGRSHFKTKVITEIVKEFYETKGARPSVDYLLQQIEDKYCGNGGLIDYPDDIDYENKLLHFRQHGRQRGEPSKRITFKTLNNQISKIFKKISN